MINIAQFPTQKLTVTQQCAICDKADVSSALFTGEKFTAESTLIIPVGPFFKLAYYCEQHTPKTSQQAEQVLRPQKEITA